MQKRQMCYSAQNTLRMGSLRKIKNYLQSNSNFYVLCPSGRVLTWLSTTFFHLQLLVIFVIHSYKLVLQAPLSLHFTLDMFCEWQIFKALSPQYVSQRFQLCLSMCVFSISIFLKTYTLFTRHVHDIISTHPQNDISVNSNPSSSERKISSIHCHVRGLILHGISVLFVTRDIFLFAVSSIVCCSIQYQV